VRAIHRALYIAAPVLLCGLSCLAQSNDVSTRAVTFGAQPLTGYKVAAVRYTPICEVGSPPNVFGILAGDYWTDSAGHFVPWAVGKPGKPGYSHHQFTRVLMGPVSFSLPLGHEAVGVISVVVVLLIGFLVITRVTRGRTSKTA